MNILLDSHIILWALTNDDRLSHKARMYIMSPRNTIFYSVVSIWELAIKHSKYPDDVSLGASELIFYCDAAGFSRLDLMTAHIPVLETLHRNDDAPKHKDPFDKMLIAQAKAEDMIFLTHDALLPFYAEDCIVSV